MKIYHLFALLIPLAIINGCSKDEDEPTPAPSTGAVTGIITDQATAFAIENAAITLFKADNNEAISTIITDSTGIYSFTAAGGNYFVKVSAQGYDAIPSPGFSAISFTIGNGATLTNDVAMTANSDPNSGSISGTVTSGSTGTLGVMVVASNGTEAYSAYSDAEGHYRIYNVTAGTYDVKGWKAGITSAQSSTTVTAGTNTSDVDITVTVGVTGSVAGSITFLATQNKEVDVALTHPLTGETVPGLSTVTSGGNYTIVNVSDGQYLARASYSNDGIVMDPDWIVKNGEPFVSVSGAAATRDFSVTGAVELSSPTNASTTTVPVEVSSTTPTFTWTSFSSTSDYVIEVSDSKGNVIWGGFNSDWTVKNIVIPSSQTSIQYNSDGNATQALSVGQIYRWRIFASKDAQGGASWNLISSSEDQMGLIKIIQ